MRKTVFTLMTLCGSLMAHAQNHYQYNSFVRDAGAHEKPRNVDVRHMKLEVKFKPDSALVIGKVRHTFRCLQEKVDTLFLNGPGIEVMAARLVESLPKKKPNEIVLRTLNFRTVAEGVVLLFDPPLTMERTWTVELEYRAKPKKGIYFIGWNLPEAAEPAEMTRRQIWTQGQGIDNRHWIPMVDDMSDKFITETVVTFDEKYKVLSNGSLISKNPNKDRTITWHYRMPQPHAGYLLMLGIGNYAVKSTLNKYGTPINFWYYPEHPERLEPSSMYSEKIIEFLSEETGVAYPWGSYSQIMVQDFMYGAMENTSATIFGDFFWVDSRGFLDNNYIGVNAHEATHQWFGDLVTARNGADVWLQESFATFYPKLFTGVIKGFDEMIWGRRGEQNAAVNAGEKDMYAVRSTMGGTTRVYPKGSAVLSMMRYVLGEDKFKRSITAYLKKHAFQNVETNDLWQAIMDETGVNLDWFFEQWLYKGGEPHYRVQWQNVAGGTEISVEQIHEQNEVIGLFKMPVNVAVYYTDGTADRQQVLVEKVNHRFVIPNSNNNKVAFVLFDENSELIKKVSFDKTFDELTAQLQHAQYMIDRYDALVALKKYPMEKRRKLLEDAYGKESFWAMRQEIARQLTADAGTSAEWHKKFSSDAAVQVRQAFCETVALNPGTEPLLANMLTDSSYRVIETALTRLMDYQPESGRRTWYLEQTKGLNGMLHSLKIKWLEYAIEQVPDMAPTHRTLIVNYAGPEYEFRTRQNAFQALRRLNLCTEQVSLNLFQASLSNNGRLAGPAKELIAYFKQQTATRKIMKAALEKFSCSPEEKKTLEALLN